MHVATYIEGFTAGLSDPSVKQHLAAIRMLFDWLVTGPDRRLQSGLGRARPQTRRQEGQNARAYRRSSAATLGLHPD